MTENWFEYDRNRQLITTNFNLLNLTENNFIFGHIHKLILVIVAIFIVFSIFSHIQPDLLVVVAIFIVFSIFCRIQPDMFIVVAIFILNFSQVHQVNFHLCQFSVMFKFFCHIHSVIMNWSC